MGIHLNNYIDTPIVKLKYKNLQTYFLFKADLYFKRQFGKTVYDIEISFFFFPDKNHANPDN
jgi:hypothetical protein